MNEGSSRRTSSHSPAYRLGALFNVEHGQWRPVLLSALCFCCTLTALMLLRPARCAGHAARHRRGALVVHRHHAAPTLWLLTEENRSNHEPSFRNLVLNKVNGPNSTTGLPSSLRASR